MSEFKQACLVMLYAAAIIFISIKLANAAGNSPNCCDYKKEKVQSGM